MAPTTDPAALARTFRALHIPSHPLLLTNIHDAASAHTIASLPSTHALATASYAIAACAGVPDASLDLATNLSAIRPIARVAKQHSLPLTVDFQDGYGARLQEGVEALLSDGGVGEGVVVGINLEDFDREKGELFTISEAVGRIRKVLEVASRAGIEGFVVNARADPLLIGGTVAECVERGRAYLDAGATTVFVLGGTEGRKVLRREEIEELVDAFGGMVNIGLKLGEGNMTARELAELGVARISLGPELHFAALKTLKEEAEKVMAN